MKIDHVTNSLLTLQKAYKFRRDSEVGYMLTDNDIIIAIVEACKREVTYNEAGVFFTNHYPEIKNYEAKK